MITAFVMSIIYGPIVVTLACWLLLSKDGDRSGRRRVVRVLSRDGRDHDRTTAKAAETTGVSRPALRGPA